MAPESTRLPIITLLTDFGLQDVYVGVMKGVILGLNPRARLVDLSHDVPPQDVVAAAFLLNSAWGYFPPGTIHLAVVDPGVGSSRRALAAAVGEQFFVGPDNGLVSLILAENSPASLVSLESTAYFLPRISATFHGRDIFAPVAAHLSLGVPLAHLGPAVGDPVGLDFPAAVVGDDRLAGQIVWCDHFGNLISNITMAQLQTWGAGRAIGLWLEGRRIPDLGQTYSEVAPGALLGLGGSHGYLEIACRGGSAAQVLGAGAGAKVTVRLVARNT